MMLLTERWLPAICLQVLALLQQLTALPSRALMRDACTALLARPVVDDVAAQLSAALQQLDLAGESGRHSVWYTVLSCNGFLFVGCWAFVLCLQCVLLRR